MTFIIGVKDGDDAFLFCDSALTHRRGPPTMPQSSFGESQIPDGRTVEELMIKIFEFPKRVLVAVAGDLDDITVFLNAVEKRLSHSKEPLEEIVASQRASIEGSGYQVMFAHLVDGSPQITCTKDGQPPFRVQDGSPVIAGSLPDVQRSLMLRLATTTRAMEAPPPVRVAATLTALQSLSVQDYLPAHGVGGAFFGAHLGRRGVSWQPDITYTTYSTYGAGVEEDPPAHVFVRVEDGVAVVASLNPPIVKRMVPPYRRQRPRSDLTKAKAASMHRFVAKSKHFAFVSRRYRKAAYIQAPSNGQRGLAWAERRGEGVAVGPNADLARDLDEVPPPDVFEMLTHFDREDGSRVGRKLHMPLDTPASIEIKPVP